MARLLKVSRQPDSRPEIFHSVQGEGANIGKPAVFLRLSLCNLACTWCDTRYTWDWEQYDPKEQILEMPVEDIAREILRYDCRYLVVTGGEPLIQHKELVPLLKHLKNYYIEIETNGTIVPRPELVGLIDQWSVSPKLENSGNPPSARESPRAYKLFSELPSSCFKYVIQEENDLVEVKRMIQEYDIAREKVALMPEGKDTEAILDRSRWLVELCKNEGYMLSTRLQVLLWGNQRGM